VFAGKSRGLRSVPIANDEFRMTNIE